MIDRAAFGEKLDAIMASAWGARVRSDLNVLRLQLEGEFGAPLDPACHMAAIAAYAECAAERFAEQHRTAVWSYIMMTGTADYAASRTSHAMGCA